PSCGGTATAVHTISVNNFNGISGHVNFTASPYYGAVKIWLITYNPATLYLEAIDSTTAYASGSSVYYKFSGVPTDSYRVKAAVYDTFGTATGMGYVPTYHTSSFYWYAADVINHTSGTADVNKD